MLPEKSSEMFAAIAAEAESAVASVKDPQLRSVAFEKILSTLIEQRANAGKLSAGVKERPQKGKKKNPKPNRPEKALRGGPKAHIEVLIEDGFFKNQRTIADVKAELANRGHHIPLTSLSAPLLALTQERRLRRQKVATKGNGTKTTYAYSNW